jgi:hypothetical protein
MSLKLWRNGELGHTREGYFRVIQQLTGYWCMPDIELRGGFSYNGGFRANALLTTCFF